MAFAYNCPNKSRHVVVFMYMDTERRTSLQSGIHAKGKRFVQYG